MAVEPITSPLPRVDVSTGLRLIDVKAVTAKTTLSRSKIYAMLNEGKFPAPVKISTQITRWVESEIDAWIESLRLNLVNS
jgi:prophage regulatory protein